MQVRKSAIQVPQAVFVWLFAAGCAATGPAFTPVNPIPAGKGVVYVYREPKVVGCAVKGTVSANDTLITMIKNGGYYPYIAHPGPVHFAVTCGETNTADVTVRPGEEEYLKTTVGAGFFGGQLNLTEVSSAIGSEEIRRCKLLKSVEPSVRPLSNADFKKFRYFGLGYSGNIPREVLGMSVFLTRPKGFGVYFDVKTTAPLVSRVQYFATGRPVLNERTEWLSFNVAITRAVSRVATIYAGVGHSGGVKCRQYYDPQYIFATDGKYWMEVDRKSALNVLGGILLALHPNAAVQMGFEAQPAGLTLGYLGMW